MRHTASLTNLMRVNQCSESGRSPLKTGKNVNLIVRPQKHGINQMVEEDTIMWKNKCRVQNAQDVGKGNYNKSLSK